MGFKIIVSPRAQKEIENAIDFYSLYSEKAPIRFIIVLLETYQVLEINPFFSVRYKTIRALKLKRFPYSIYFEVNEDERVVRVLSCFHNNRHPSRRPPK